MKYVKSLLALVTVISILASLIVHFPSASAQNANLAEGCTVTATAQLSNYDISRVTDGQTSASADSSKTAITSFDSAGYGFYEISFSSETEIDVVKLYFNQLEARQRPRDIAVDIKRKDGVYVRVAEMHNIDYEIKNNGNGGVNELEFKFAPAECVSVRITGNRQRTRDINNEPTSNYNFRLMEIAAFNDSAISEDDYTGVLQDEQSKYNIPVPAPVFENLIAGSEVQSTLQLGTYAISRLTDGKNDVSSDCSITSFNTANLSYSEISLENETAINHVRLYFSHYEVSQRPKDIAIDIRLKNGVYVRAAELHNIDYGIISANSARVNVLDFTFKELDAVAIRVTGNRQRTRDINNEPTKQYNFRLVEVEGYFNPILKETEYTGTLADENDAYNIPVPDPVLENLAVGKNVTTYAELTAGAVTYYASNLTDGNTDYNAETQHNAITRWNTATKMAHYEIDLENTVKINRVGVFLTRWETNQLPLDIAVDVRMANGVYVRVAEMHNINYQGKEKLMFSFEEIDAVAVRVTGNCARNTSSGNFRLMEIEVYHYPNMPEDLFTGVQKDADDKYNIPVPEPLLTNVAAGKDVVANETLNAGNVTYKAEFLTDGNKDYNAETQTNAITKWNNTTKIGYYEIDLGEAITINQVAVFLTKWQTEYLPLDMAIDVRLENGVYVRVAEMHGIDYTAKESITFSFEEVKAVAVRVTGNCARNTVSENFRLMEIEVYYYTNIPTEKITGTEKDADDKYNIPVPDPLLTNLAAGKKVTANETLVVKDLKYDAAFLTDGNNNYFMGTETTAITKWYSPTKCGWYEVEFGKEETINRVAVFLSQWQKDHLPKDMAVDVRLSNGVYVRVAEMHNINYTDVKQLTFSFKDISAVAFRVTGNRARNEISDNFRLAELEAYYYPNMPESEITGTVADAKAEYNIEVPEPLLKNLALGMTVTANDELEANGVVYSTNRLTDGFTLYNCDSAVDYTAITKWMSKKMLGWYEVAFKAPTKLNQVKVYLSRWETNFLPLDMAVEVKLENGEYVRVAEMHNIDYSGKQNLTFAFPEQTAVAFRVIGNANRNEISSNFRLIELEAYYWPGMPASKYTGTAQDANPLYNINIENLTVESGTDSTNKPAKKPNTSISGVAFDKSMVANTNVQEAEAEFKLEPYHYIILFVIAAGFVVVTFIAGSVFVLLFTNARLKKK